MERRARLHLLIAAAVLTAATARARVLMTQQQALAAAFPGGATRQTVFLTPPELAAAQRESGLKLDDQLVVRYVGMAAGKIAGYAYFDTHRVRTLPETVMVVVTPEGRIDRVEILAFDEPTDYFPKRRWIDQLLGRKLDPDLSLNRAIRPLSGASLTAQALVNVSRKILAIHDAIGARAPR